MKNLKLKICLSVFKRYDVEMYDYICNRDESTLDMEEISDYARNIKNQAGRKAKIEELRNALIAKNTDNAFDKADGSLSYVVNSQNDFCVAEIEDKFLDQFREKDEDGLITDEALNKSNDEIVLSLSNKDFKTYCDFMRECLAEMKAE